MEKTCSKCLRKLDINQFSKDRYNQNGYTASCKECRNHHKQVYRTNNPTLTKLQQKIQRQNNPYNTWANCCISDHKKRGFIVNFGTAVLANVAKQFPYCFYCNCSLNWTAGKGKILSNSPSLDNKDANQIIDIENIIICCFLCNKTKGDRTFDEFVNYCSIISDRFSNPLRHSLQLNPDFSITEL